MKSLEVSAEIMGRATAATQAFTPFAAVFTIVYWVIDSLVAANSRYTTLAEAFTADVIDAVLLFVLVLVVAWSIAGFYYSVRRGVDA